MPAALADQCADARLIQDWTITRKIKVSRLTATPCALHFRLIRSIRRKGLNRLFQDDDPSGVNPEHVTQLRDILATLHAAPTVAIRIYAHFGCTRLRAECKGFGL